MRRHEREISLRTSKERGGVILTGSDSKAGSEGEIGNIPDRLYRTSENANLAIDAVAFLEVGSVGGVLPNFQARQMRGGVVWVGYARGFEPLKNRQWSFVP